MMPGDSDQPLELFFDKTNKVLLAAFSGVFTRQTTLDLDAAAKVLVAEHGAVAVILDFTNVTELGLQLRDWPQLATSRRTIRGTRRILVLPSTPVFTPLRLHGFYRGNAGDNTDVVITRKDALRELGLANPAFEPIPPPG